MPNPSTKEFKKQQLARLESVINQIEPGVISLVTSGLGLPYLKLQEALQELRSEAREIEAELED